jgi:hypothetical protein
LGPNARVIIAGAPGITPGDATILGTHNNAIVLEWGWRTYERQADPSTTEFRIYATQPPDTINATVNSVTSASPNWQLSEGDIRRVSRSGRGDRARRS